MSKTGAKGTRMSKKKPPDAPSRKSLEEAVRREIISMLDEVYRKSEDNASKVYNGKKSLQDFIDLQKKYLPDAISEAILTDNTGAYNAALEKTLVGVFMAMKAREESDWKPHAMRADAQVRNDDPTLKVEERAKAVAEILASKGIRGRGGKLLTGPNIKRDLLRSKGYKIPK